MQVLNLWGEWIHQKDSIAILSFCKGGQLYRWEVASLTFEILHKWGLLLKESTPRQSKFSP